jgi:GntR family transcriptional regulator, transcriptional repressor for pyruvate dehydrogenase complex
VADQLMTRIFRGDFPAGSSLPPERRFAEELGVDRTTLRMALKQLQRMKLVVARHGSGIQVTDYRAQGGLEVLAAMFALDDLPLDPSFMVEALDFWLESFSMTAAKAIARLSLEEVRRIEGLLERAASAGDDVDALIEAQLEVQDELARLSGSVLFRMLSNSTRSLRRRFLYLLVDTVDLPASIQEIKHMLRVAVMTRPAEEVVRKGLHEGLKKQTAALREQLLFGTPGSDGRAARSEKPARRRPLRK